MALSPAQIASAVSATLKEVYAERITAQMYRGYPFLAEISRTMKNIEIGHPSFARIPILVGENPGIGARGFMSPVPAANLSQHEQGRVTLKYNYGALIVPGQYLKSTSQSAAFAAYLTHETEQLRISAQRDSNRQHHGDGRGILVAPAAQGPTNTITVPTAGDLKFLFRRRRVDIIEITTGVALALDREVTAKNLAGPTFTIDGAAVTIPANHAVYNAGSRNEEVTGFAAMISNTNPLLSNYQNVDASTITEWQATVTDAATATGGPNPTEELFQFHVDSIEQNSSSTPNKRLIVTTYPIRAEFASIINNDRRIVNKRKMEGGWEGVEWNGNMIAVDKDTPTGTAWFADLEYIRTYQMADWEFMDKGGSRLQPDLQGRDAYTATLFKYAELGTTMRSAHGRIINIT